MSHDLPADVAIRYKISGGFGEAASRPELGPGDVWSRNRCLLLLPKIGAKTFFDLFVYGFGQEVRFDWNEGVLWVVGDMRRNRRGDGQD